MAHTTTTTTHDAQVRNLRRLAAVYGLHADAATSTQAHHTNAARRDAAHAAVAVARTPTGLRTAQQMATAMAATRLALAVQADATHAGHLGDAQALDDAANALWQYRPQGTSTTHVAVRRTAMFARNVAAHARGATVAARAQR